MESLQLCVCSYRSLRYAGPESQWEAEAGMLPSGIRLQPVATVLSATKPFSVCNDIHGSLCIGCVCGIFGCPRDEGVGMEHILEAPWLEGCLAPRKCFGSGICPGHCVRWAVLLLLLCNSAE